MNLHQNKPPTWLVHIPGHPWVLGQATGTLDYKTHHGPDSGEATTFPHIVFFAPRFRDYIQMALFPGTPKLESRNCPETVQGGVPGLWELITPDYKVWSQRGLNQTCSPRRHLSNDVSHSQFGGQEEVDSRLLVVPALLLPITWATDVQMANARPFSISTLQDLSNDTKNTPNARCFGPCCRALNIRESRKTPNPHFFQVLGFTPTLGQSRVATTGLTSKWLFSPGTPAWESRNRASRDSRNFGAP
jgi:hypothetical protein